jgi:streptomycin 6-kinase
VRLYEADPERLALLLERCEPGTTLAHAGLPPDKALAVGAGLLTSLWAVRPPPGLALERLEDVMSDWAAEGWERWERHRPPYDPDLVRTGLDLLESLPQSASRRVVLHGDFNPGNVLRAQRQPWLAIDPKPMIGDPGFDLEPLLSQIDRPYAKTDPANALRQRCDTLATATAEPFERVVAWALARTIQSALWCAAYGHRDDGQADMADAAVLASLRGERPNSTDARTYREQTGSLRLEDCWWSRALGKRSRRRGPPRSAAAPPGRTMTSSLWVGTR